MARSLRLGVPTSCSRATRRWPTRPPSARPMGSRSEDSANTIVVIGKAEPAGLRRLRRPGDDPARRQPDRSVSGWDAQGVVRRRRRDPGADRDGDRRGHGLRPATPTCRSSSTPGSWLAPRIVLGGGSRSWKVLVDAGDPARTPERRGRRRPRERAAVPGLIRGEEAGLAGSREVHSGPASRLAVGRRRFRGARRFGIGFGIGRAPVGRSRTPARARMPGAPARLPGPARSARRRGAAPRRPAMGWTRRAGCCPSGGRAAGRRGSRDRA